MSPRYGRVRGDGIAGTYSGPVRTRHRGRRAPAQAPRSKLVVCRDLCGYKIQTLHSGACLPPPSAYPTYRYKFATFNQQVFGCVAPCGDFGRVPRATTMEGGTSRHGTARPKISSTLTPDVKATNLPVITYFNKCHKHLQL